MDVAIFSAKPHDRLFLAAANEGRHELAFIEARLSEETVRFAGGATCICAFVNDQVTAPVIGDLAAAGTKLIALRSAGFNHVDLAAAAAAGLTVGRVPAYSPHAVAEHAVALILTLNRNTHRAFNRVREGNFALEGLLGFDLCGKTVGVVGTGLIGRTFAGIMLGFGCRVIASDPFPSEECTAMGVTYVPFDRLLAEADIISLQCPLTPETHHLIDDDAIARMKRGAMIVNTSRGAVVDASAVIRGLKSGMIGALGLDVYEEEANLFFEDLSQKPIQDDVFARLLTFPNVVITGHQAFFTCEALTGIARTTIDNITAFEDTGRVLHPVLPPVA
ncbi:2-hydroxyacid dehydrogenase [Cereibacter sphaeroides]|uniref:2-hydroxyacid dehydrogenase n=1 Tax=Cereibacter sphaeroides TaxID=1063 RepID=UPI001F22E310|nr:2-hydroxyacid dehydrogenase [Cereibacter sphaeroides]MCE6951035.1 2-hydroxyacid dehydrogenase [Cereibacter sphaeroides]